MNDVLLLIPLLFSPIHGCQISCDLSVDRICEDDDYEYESMFSSCSGLIGCMNVTTPCLGECLPEYPVLSEDGLRCSKPRTDKTICRSNIDTIVNLYGDTSYVFVGNDYSKMIDDDIAPGYPRKISENWPGLPGNIDAAVTWTVKHFTYFFKGDKYWRFNDETPSPGYPKDISNWRLPANLDAAVEWGRNNDLYFFKGSQYWKYDTSLQTMDETYPRDISNWRGIPGDIDDAFQWNNGKTYFFKSGKYWRFNDETFSVDRSNPAYPRDAGQWWFGCPKKSRPASPQVAPGGNWKTINLP